MNKILLIILSVFPITFLLGQTDLKKPFEDCGIGGSITIYDYNAKKWISSDINDSYKGTLPASTFKILNTLIALETNAVSDENEIFIWPGETDTVKYGYRPEIYHDMNLREAFKLSAVWVYLELANRIGRENYNKFLTQCNYGNKDISVNDNDFWNFGNLAVSPANQIEILIGIYEETLPFSKKSYEILKKIMVEEQTEKYTLYAKTGWTRYGGKDTGWWVGYVESRDNVWFFATRLIKNRNTVNPDFGRCRKEITRNILQQMKVFD